MAGWNTIESDAGVFTSMIETLGVRGAQFEELVALDVPSLAALQPYGVIFLFRCATEPQPDGTPSTTDLFFARQTIQNACGTQALLSVLLNRDDVDIGPTLREFKDFTQAFPPDLRGEALSNSDAIRTVHNAFARAVPFADETQREADPDDDLYHFIAYTAVDGTLYELDGLQPAPLSHGACTDFATAVVPVLQRRIAQYPENEIRFNLLALTKDPRPEMRAAGDAEGLAREERRRAAWAWENALRRHNLVGFVGEVLCGVVGGMGKEAYQQWVEEGVKKTEERVKRERDRRKAE